MPNFLQKDQGECRKIPRELSERKGVRIIETECCPDHIHMLVEILPHLSAASFMGYLKNKSGLKIFNKHSNIRTESINTEIGTSGAGALCKHSG